MAKKRVVWAARLLEKQYEIEITDRSSCGGSWGVVNFGQQLISLAEDVHPEARGQSLLHELLHVADHHTGDDLLEEKHIVRLSIALWSMLKRNKHLIPVILGEEKES